MRGRSLWRETPKSSICAFCAHRLSATRFPSHVRQRFISSSQSTSNSFGAAAAIKEEEDSPAPVDSSSTRSRPFGRPAFGKPAFGAAASRTSSTATEDFRTPAFGSGKVELTDDEKRLRDSLREVESRKKQVPIAVYAGLGPETYRSGRADPIEHKRAKEAQKAEQMSRRGQAMSKHNSFASSKDPLNSKLPSGQASAQQGSAPIRQMRTEQSSSKQESSGGNRVFTVSNPLTNRGHKQSNPNEGTQWGQLRRRGEQQPSQPNNIAHTNRFTMGRREREDRAQTKSFIPLSSSASSLTRREQPATWDRLVGVNQNDTHPRRHKDQQHNTQRIEPPGKASGLIRRINLQNGSGEQKTLEHNEDSSRSQWRSRDSHQNLPNQRSNATASRVAGDLTFEARKKLYEKEETRAVPAHSKASASRRYEEPPRGKGRDKARRRQQFGDPEEEEELAEERALRAEEKKARKKAKADAKKNALVPIILPPYISVSNLAVALKVKYEAFAEKLEELGFEEFAPDYVLNGEDAGLIAGEYKYEPIIDRGESDDLKARPPPEDPSILPQRPPVVTIMGHVDHGKTTLLDYLRKSSVAASEHGGITQHIGAFSVPMPSGKIITFLDTPGHAAFLNMRQRGANVTDIVILVVAADDSVKPQTIEAINHAKAAKVPIIVAINKIDKEDANIDRVKQDLARHGVDVEDFGGDTQVVPVSGKTGQGLDQLEETVITLSEVLDMRAETDGPAEGWVLEASIKPMGKVATILVRRGTMRPGDVIVAGNTWARIRCLRNEAGVEIDHATPGTPVEIDGWRELPLAGDEVLEAESEDQAKTCVDYRLEKIERDKLAEDMEAINESRKSEQARRIESKRVADLDEEQRLAESEADGGKEKRTGVREVYFIIKGDVSGSVEAVIDSISAVGNEEVIPNIMRSGVGQLTEFDVEHAAAANGVLVNFNTPIEPAIAGAAERAKVPILDHNVIYRLVDDVKAKMSEYLSPLVTQRVLGEADIAQVFEITVKGRQQKSIAGVKVRNGTVSKAARVRVLRHGEKIFDGVLSSLKNVKKDVSEMRKGSECGMGFEGWTDFQVGDQVQCYETKEEKRYL